MYNTIVRVIEACEKAYVDKEVRDSIILTISDVLADYPQFFWFEGKFRTRIEGSKIEIIPKYVYSSQEIEEGKRQIESIVSYFESLSFENDIVKIKTVYDWLLDNVEYSSENGGQNIYNALVERKAVCKGISKAYQHLLPKLGAHCVIEYGTIDGHSRHAWNVVDLDKQTYYVDVSLANRQFDFLFEDEHKDDRYRCFMKTRRMFEVII